MNLIRRLHSECIELTLILRPPLEEIGEATYCSGSLGESVSKARTVTSKSVTIALPYQTDPLVDCFDENVYFDIVDHMVD